MWIVLFSRLYSKLRQSQNMFYNYFVVYWKTIEGINSLICEENQVMKTKSLI